MGSLEIIDILINLSLYPSSISLTISVAPSILRFHLEIDTIVQLCFAAYNSEDNERFRAESYVVVYSSIETRILRTQ